MRLIDPLVAAARAWPDRPAVSDGAVRWTYGQLERIAARGARWLAAQGIGRGDRVALLAGESAPTVAAIHAVRRAGAVLLPLTGSYVTLRDLIEWTSKDAVRFFFAQPQARYRLRV